MIYYDEGDIVIRNMEQADIAIIVEEEIAQGWHPSTEGYEMRLKDQAEGCSVALTALYKGKVAGYVNVYRNGLDGAFAGKGYPEIVDFGVLERYRKRGIGTKLMDVAEEIAATFSDTVYLGVGLHSGYGSAQRMYVKRGYIPDGSGVWYNEQVWPQYENCCNNDDLVLYFSKELRLGQE